MASLQAVNRVSVELSAVSAGSVAGIEKMVRPQHDHLNGEHIRVKIHIESHQLAVLVQYFQQVSAGSRQSQR